VVVESRRRSFQQEQSPAYGRAIWAGFINGALLRLVETDLHRGKPQAMFQEDRSTLPGAPARFRWQSGAGLP
jgi:hypothetical protein